MVYLHRGGVATAPDLAEVLIDLEAEPEIRLDVIEALMWAITNSAVSRSRRVQSSLRS